MPMVHAWISIFNFVVSGGCSDEIPCQPGFLCSPDKKCIPASDVIAQFSSQLKDPHIPSGTTSVRALRETKLLDEDGNYILSRKKELILQY